jgi:glycosyltransferase involved in cell wall biosynthesis
MIGMEANPVHICVVTPTHNRADYLPETVESVRANVKTQNPTNFTFDHLICANGCTDGTNEWLEKNANANADVPIRFRIENGKMLPGYARNHVIQDAPSDAWISPLDDDDIMLQRNLYYYAYNIQMNPDKQWFINDFVRVDSELRYRPKEDYYHWKFDNCAEMLRAIFRGECFAQGNVCYSKKLFDEVGGYHEKLSMAEDLDLYVRFLLAGQLPGYSPHISHLHRCHNRNISIGVDAAKHHDDLKCIYDRYADKLKALDVEYHPRDFKK